MKATELRIGNLVRTTVTNTDIIITIDELIEICINEPKDHQLEPIPLTEEWLLKFGFFEDGLYYSIQINDVYLSIDKTDKTFCIGVPYEANGTDIKFQYVHQLQNLYHALTGNELTISK